MQVTPEQPTAPDFEPLARRLAAVGSVALNGLVLEFSTEQKRLLVFPDSRVLVMGTTDPAVARSLVARYLGC